MVKKSYTMIELIFVIIVLSLIATGSFKAIGALYNRYYEIKTVTHFSMTTQGILNQITTLLYYRVPITAIGYNPDNGDFKPLKDANSSYKIAEWIGEAFDAKLHIGNNIGRGYSGFIDLDASDRDTLTLVAEDFNVTDINDTENKIFNTNRDLNETVAIIFAGSFDLGDESANNDYNNSFGWHGHDHNKTYTIHSFKQVNSDANLTMNDEIKNNRIYAKYYLANSAWGIARGENIDQNATCITDFGMEVNSNELNNTLFLFYDYRPWKKDTFCADPNHDNDTRNGKVAILAKNVTAFRVKAVNNHIELKIQQTKYLYRGSDRNISIAKQKVAF
ncbi:MAG: hypothetical protein DSY40_01980 [Nautilia sp.]|nr:MAG: hypothetical protein DSY40_01980 [Nautilia sp.]